MLTEDNSVQKYLDIKRSGVSSRLQLLRMASSVLDLQNLPIWRATVAEVVSTGILVFMAIMAGAADPKNNMPASSLTHLALMNGLAVGTLVWIFGDISGAQMNPAVTFAFLMTRRTSVLRFGLYFLAQGTGAIIGAAMSMALLYREANPNLAVTTINPKVTEFQGFCMEFFMTFLLMLTVMATSDAERPDLGGSRPLSVGLCVCLNILVFISMTGASMNPVRSFAPALLMGKFDNHWIYWLGPMLGGSAGAIFYDHMIYKYATPQRFWAYIVDSDYMPEGVHPIRVTASRHERVVLQSIKDAARNDDIMMKTFD